MGDRNWRKDEKDIGIEGGFPPPDPQIPTPGPSLVPVEGGSDAESRKYTPTAVPTPPLDSLRVDRRELFGANKFGSLILEAFISLLFVVVPVMVLVRRAKQEVVLWSSGVSYIGVLLVILGVAILGLWIIPEMSKRIALSRVGAVWEREVLQPYVRSFPKEEFAHTGSLHLQASVNKGMVIVAVQKKERDENGLTIHVPERMPLVTSFTRSGKPEVWAHAYPRGVGAEQGVLGFACDFVYVEPPNTKA